MTRKDVELFNMLQAELSARGATQSLVDNGDERPIRRLLLDAAELIAQARRMRERLP